MTHIITEPPQAFELFEPLILQFSERKSLFKKINDDLLHYIALFVLSPITSERNIILFHQSKTLKILTQYFIAFQNIQLNLNKS